jgi:hypothetical protein
MPKANTPEETKRRAEKAAATRAATKAAKDAVNKASEDGTLTAQTKALLDENVLKNEMKTDMEPAAQDNNPAVNNGMAVNKPMAEYSTTETVQRTATPEEEAAHIGDEPEPRRLVIGEGPGNLMVIKWNRGGGRVPHNCTGGWNNKQLAQNAINSAYSKQDFTETQLDEVG